MKSELEYRHEIKFSLPAQFTGDVHSWIKSHPDGFYRLYPARRVNNVYFDTFNRSFEDDHVNGIYERAKLRYRWYGDSWLAAHGQLELKLKKGALGAKEIRKIDSEIDFRSLSWKEIIKKLGGGTDELQLLLMNTQPVLINHYLREYFASSDQVIRITLDRKLTLFQQRMGFSPNIKFANPAEDLIIIEIKAAKNQEKRISDVIAGFPFYATQFSKYLRGVQER